MDRLAEFLRRFRYLGRRRELDQELEEEMHFHLDLNARQFVKAGMPEEEARYAAIRAFGNRDLLMEDSRSAWRFNFIETLLQDIRYGFRILARNRVFAAAVVFTLALGIGANTAIFTLIDAAMLRSLPVRDPERLYVLGSQMSMSMIMADKPGERSASFLSYPLYREFREHNEVFSDLAAISSFYVHAYVSPDVPSSGAAVEKADAWLVTGNFFSLLDIRPILGRVFAPEDDQTPGGEPVAVISHGYWTRRFGKDSSIVGRILRMNGSQYTILGVTSPDFFGVTPGISADIWVPTMMQSQLMREPSYLSDRNCMWMRYIGRLKPHLTQSEASMLANGLFHRLLREEAGSEITPTVDEAISRLKMDLVPFAKGFGGLRESLSHPLIILMGAVGLVLLIACANVGNLLLARASGRRREVALRLALGSSRSRLLRQLLTESLMLALAGGSIALLMTGWTMDLLWAFFSHSTLEFQLNSRILGFTFLVSVGTTVIFGLAPALRSSRVDLITSLRNLGATPQAKQEGGHLRKALVISQVAISLLLLIGAGLFIRSLQNLRSVETGFRGEGVLQVEIDPQGGGYQKEELPHLYRELVERTESIPGVDTASMSLYGLFSGAQRNNDVTIPFYLPQSEDDLRIQETFVTPDYFRTVGIPILFGRGFKPEDRKGSARVAIVNETFARHFFGNESPIGRRFGTDGEGSGNDIEIIGMARDVKYGDLRAKTPRFAYYPVFQAMTYLQSIEVRSSMEPQAIAPMVRMAITEAGKNLPVLEVTTLNEQIDRTLRKDKVISRLTSLFGLLSLFLASLGLYGVMAYVVARRTNEIGIRLALGANRVQVLWMILRDTLILVGSGIALGIPAALAVTRSASSLLYDLDPTDPATMLAATIFLCFVALLAGYLPARRASLLDPAIALRYE